MKKNNFLMLLALVFLITACKTELDPANEALELHNISKMHNAINLSTFKKETKVKNINNILPVAEKHKHGKNAPEITNYYIDTTSVYKMQINNNQATYALRAYNLSEDPHNVYSLVYRVKEGETDYTLFKI